MIRMCTCQTCGWNEAKNPFKDHRKCSLAVNSHQECRQRKRWQSKEDVLQLQEQDRIETKAW